MDGGLPHAHFHDHGSRVGRWAPVAEPALGASLSHSLFGLFIREASARRGGKAVYVTLGITFTEDKKLFGLWVSETEGAKCWLRFLRNYHNEGGLLRRLRE